MLLKQRSAVLTLPAVGAALPVTATIDIRVEEWTKFIFADTTHLTNTSVVSNPNTELVTPATITITDPAVLGRYVLLSTTMFSHSRMPVMVYYDNKYNDVFILPSLEIYSAMSYLSAKNFSVSAYGVNFSGVAGDKVPVVNTGVDIRADIWQLARPATSNKAGYVEIMLTANTNFNNASTNATVGLNFGPVGALFATTGFIADINILGYNSLFEWQVVSMGKQKVTPLGSLMVELPF